jgi:integrase
MAVKWYKIGKGLQATDHESRKHGKRFDRYIRARFRVDGKLQTFGLGWESEWVAGEKARMLAEGDTSPRRSFVDYCQGELARLKDNAKRGLGPVTPKEERALAQAQAQEEEQARREEEKKALTFSQFFEKEYIPTAKTHKKPKTMQEEQSIYKVWLEPYIGKMRLVDLRPLHMERVKKVMLDDGKAPRRVQYALAVIRQTWNMARSRGLVQGDWPGKDVKVPSFDNRRMRFLTSPEADELLAEIKKRSEQTHNIALISMDCGLRFGEIVKLQWGHIDTDNMTIRVVDPKGTKGTKSRTAFMTQRVKEMFKSLPQGIKTDLVFKDREHGGQIQKISHAFWRSVDKLKLNDGVEDRRDKIVFHSLRHSYASNLVAAGADLYVVSQLLGHSDVTMAARYSHLRADSLRQAVANMEEATSAKEPQKADVTPIKKVENT